MRAARWSWAALRSTTSARRSEEHTSELQSQSNLVCRLLLEKKKKQYTVRPCHCISRLLSSSFFFFFNDTATPEIYPLSLPDALPISDRRRGSGLRSHGGDGGDG